MAATDPTITPAAQDPLTTDPAAGATPAGTTSTSPTDMLNSSSASSTAAAPAGTSSPATPNTDASLTNVPADAPGITAAQRTVDQTNGTVAGQVNKIISEDSPLLQQARTQTAQTANSRGLINTSMANQAGEQAVLNAALPIAQADAAAYNHAGDVNVAAQNDTQMQAMKGAQAQNLADTEAAYKGLLQTSASATSYFTTVSNSITSILNDATTSQATKTALVTAQQQLLKSGLAIIGAIGNINLGGLLDFQTPPP
jgi:hypothetical protein